MKKFTLWLISIALLLYVCTPVRSGEANQAEYRLISPEEAKSIMDGDVPYVLLDVRDREEYDAGHITGAVLIPEHEIAKLAEGEIPNKNIIILVYCRSGRRSAMASQKLLDIGYVNVLDFGGILSWPYDLSN